MSTTNRPTGKSTGITPIPPHQRMPKRWVEAKRKYGHTQNQRDNETVESHFMNLIHKVKQLLKHTGGTYFERDFRHDNTENAFALHAFLSSSVHLYLECSYTYVYQLDFAFHQCEYEAEIRELLDAFVFRNRKREVELNPDFSNFYSNVLRVQDSKHIYSL